ncbi:hypothetical protein H112_04050 [Trichophyton rubrum D6]|uniref:Uncharacterized protein n=2 Tax=Trichophyton rubrum TaxID=5551 RepID=A0A080WK17_TRIRC|nr:uncharacterized protein TERG_12273 [Trichophyton rubrum CBS 118892]EZF23344.1 hypothetical protein H100_04057 [Trichophyton rubrum MR850]EZF42315.1 hypothetical protein H102_04044 [Trichophyton rubrum CBS 100081]EZF52979.1 hypothetical protein H103_04057 [Trichophyton rubrum CBS 288.86]EZF63619.1 hypothetical protein H104_04043 [Trichophyton rubrum CBS 289.86]EZF84886.1 hypothetical protein H110_04051 [Trichophyton rubrum MR1448]EZF95595.1 hypothetical protein H113_04087 [Trichophyton rubr
MCLFPTGRTSQDTPLCLFYGGQLVWLGISPSGRTQIQPVTPYAMASAVNNTRKWRMPKSGKSNINCELLIFGSNLRHQSCFPKGRQLLSAESLLDIKDWLPCC